MLRVISKAKYLSKMMMKILGARDYFSPKHQYKNGGPLSDENGVVD
jgi:hypothetical protein